MQHNKEFDLTSGSLDSKLLSSQSSIRFSSWPKSSGCVHVCVKRLSYIQFSRWYYHYSIVCVVRRTSRSISLFPTSSLLSFLHWQILLYTEFRVQVYTTIIHSWKIRTVKTVPRSHKGCHCTIMFILYWQETNVQYSETTLKLTSLEENKFWLLHNIVERLVCTQTVHLRPLHAVGLFLWK